ncbi:MULTISPECIES: TIGR03643 family protein [unclassified Colwellia]|uniref:TIGR03643 family protein n=1 Tax=unclassified Colwellia TaxID=196834 RepID=UPI0015F4E4F0|nr:MULTISPECIES: TIGR03643 family protein [unclassified Colwellia]MBA6252391.1 TIGR03643 family protein [Colwellia sp. MB3u-55]MBA6399716.1 TIGR03643 family protein [Colwellia sp. BRX10-4]
MKINLKQKITQFSEEEISRIIEMAWEDRTPFEAIEQLFGVSEPQVIEIMRSSIKRKTFNNWRARVTGRKTKHLKLRSPDVSRGYCSTQYKPTRKR